MGEPISSAHWDVITARADWLCDHWDQPDEGIWETRGGPKKFLYSQLMCWVAMERAIRLATRRGLPADLERWRQGPRRDLPADHATAAGHHGCRRSPSTKAATSSTPPSC